MATIVTKVCGLFFFFFFLLLLTIDSAFFCSSPPLAPPRDHTFFLVLRAGICGNNLVTSYDALFGAFCPSLITRLMPPPPQTQNPFDLLGEKMPP